MIDENVKLDERYFKWLHKNVEPLNTRDPSRSHFILCETLFSYPFEWVVPRDENRAEYGRELRGEFLDDVGLAADNDWFSLESSVLEMLIALARTANFQTDIPESQWFWEMLDNVGLSHFTDDRYDDSIHEYVVSRLGEVLHRRYEYSGRGGFFPLRNPRRDQRKVELWYQLSAYLIENIDF